MGDGAAEGAFASGALRVEVNPLLIAGAMGELIDARLVEKDPRGDADLLADMLGQISDRHLVRGHLDILSTAAAHGLAVSN